MDLDWPRVYC